MATLLFIAFFYISAFSQGVRFREDYSLEKAIQVAQIEDKNIFIDTYTPWCGPCKIMNFQFQDKDLGEFLNKEYINIKINMDSPYGTAVKNKYDVFFLPTLLIVDKYGNVKYASEGAITSDELLSLSVHFHNEIYNADLASSDFDKTKTTIQQKDVATANVTSPAISKNDMDSKPTEAILNPSREIVRSADRVSTSELKAEEKILYTQNDKNANPDFLYNLTYLKLQLQDGTHWSAAERYLETQKDWSTKKNMKFIYDFVRRPQTKMFQHIVDNRVDYEILFGRENVSRSLSIMINMHLYQSFPRPEPKEVLELYQILDPDVAEVASYNYLLERYEEEEDFNRFVALAIKYIEEIDGDDFEIINKIATYHDRCNIGLSVNDLIISMEHAIDIQGGTYYVLYDTVSKLYQKKGKKKKALESINRAIDLANGSGVDTKQLIGRRAELVEQ